MVLLHINLCGCGGALRCATLHYAVRYSVLHCNFVMHCKIFQQIFRHVRFAERDSFCVRMQNGGGCARVLHDGGRVEDIGLVLGLWMLIILAVE